MARGYGTFYVAKDYRQEGPSLWRAHRFCWHIIYGPIPDGMHVLHNCPGKDNPACVNPAHLWLGTMDDNQKDSMRKGTRPTGDKHGLRLHPEAVRKGEHNAASVLTTTQVYAIRLYRRLGYPASQIAKAFGISASHVGTIARRKSWRHLPEKEATALVGSLGPIQDLQPRGEAMPWAKLTETAVQEIRELSAQGWKQQVLAQRYGVSQSLISMVVRRTIWTNI